MVQLSLPFSLMSMRICISVGVTRKPVEVKSPCLPSLQK